MTGSKLTRSGTVAVDGQYAQGPDERDQGAVRRPDGGARARAAPGAAVRRARGHARHGRGRDAPPGTRGARRARAGRRGRASGRGRAGGPAQRRPEIGDYLPGQRGDDERTETRRFLEESAPGRAWARTVADQLTELKHPLPEIPDG